MELLSIGIILHLFAGITAVRISVTSPVQARVHQRQVILPCEYVLDKAEEKFTVKWKLRGAIVLKRIYSGVDYPGEGYKGRVRSGDGCSLIIVAPQLEDAGQYTVRVLASGEDLDEETAEVDLKLASDSDTERSSTLSTDPTPIRADQTDISDSTTSEDQGEDPGYLVPTIILTTLSAICLSIQLFHSINDVCHRRKGESEEERRKRVWGYVLSRAVFFISIGVLCTSIFGIFRRNIVILSVGFVMFVVAFIIQIIYLKRFK